MIIETDCMPILGMVFGCATPDLEMLRWIAYIKSLDPEIWHISGKDNAMADMLSRARQRGYAQVKRELWGIVSAVKADKDYLIGTEVIIETDCMPILGMVFG